MNFFSKPTAKDMATQELHEAERQLLAYQNQQEYSTQMVKYYSDKIKRLTAYTQG